MRTSRNRDHRSSRTAITRLRVAISAFFPTIKCAMVAEMPIVLSVCPACRTITETDLRKLDYHPLATIASIIPKVSCTRCRPNAPFARITAIRPAHQVDRSPFKTWGMAPPTLKGRT